MKSAIVTGSIVCLLAGRASAQPYGPPYAPPQPAPAPAQLDTPPAAPAQPPAAAVQPGDPKSETAALVLSLGGALLPVGLTIGAVYSTDSPKTYGWLATSAIVSALVTPSIGHWYAGKFLTRGLGLRAAGGFTALLGVAAGLSECPINFSFGSPAEPCTPWVGISLMVIGGAAVVAGIGDDVVTAPRRVRRYNQERGFGVAPIVTPSSTGLALAGWF